MAVTQQLHNKGLVVVQYIDQAEKMSEWLTYY